jgi:hypothetical protein
MPDYQIDPHLRYDFSHPPPYGGRPPGLPPRLPRQTRYGFQPGHLPLGPPPWLRRLRRRLSLWWLRRQHRLGRWFLSLPLFRHDQQATALQLLILGLLLVVIFQAVLLILFRAR